MCMQVVVGKRRRSLVRILASYVPNFFWEYFPPVKPKLVLSVCAMEDLPVSSLYSFKYPFKANPKHSCCCQLSNSALENESAKENARIIALQNELDEIKKQIAKLMELQTERVQCPVNKTISNTDKLEKSHIPPPPPPPPLPNFPLNSVKPLKIETKKKSLLPRNGFLCGKELLRDLKKVQLKKIEKSPGGGPLKKPKSEGNSPSDIFELAVKERFGLLRKSLNFETDSFESRGDSGGQGEVLASVVT